MSRSDGPPSAEGDPALEWLPSADRRALTRYIEWSPPNRFALAIVEVPTWNELSGLLRWLPARRPIELVRMDTTRADDPLSVLEAQRPPDDPETLVVVIGLELLPEATLQAFNVQRDTLTAQRPYPWLMLVSPQTRRALDRCAPDFVDFAVLWVLADTSRRPRASAAAPEELVFISYAGPDLQHAAALGRALEALGHAVFVDASSIAPGDRWDTSIVDALNRATMVVVLISAHWRLGDARYAHDEVARAVAREPDGTRVVPVLLDHVSPIDLPSGLARLIPLRVDTRRWDEAARRLSGILRGEAARPGPGDRIGRTASVSLSRLPGGGRFFLGRAEELAALDAAWFDDVTQVQVIVGVGGDGKTALVARWLSRMARANYRGAARVYGWSFYSQGAGEDRQVSADLFIEQALRWFGDRRPSEGDPWAKGARLACLIREQPTLLVLDGLEPLQFPPGESAGRIKDPALRALLQELAAAMNGLCVVTSRQPLRDFAEATPGVATLRLQGLTGEVGAAVLRRWGVVGAEDELRAAVAEVKGHALAVNLMGSYLAMCHGGDVRQRDRIERLTDAEDGGGHAQRVMAAYDRWLNPDDRRVLRIVGLFDREADEAALRALLAPPAIAGLTDGLEDGAKGRRWKKAVAHLRGLGLLQDGGLDAHPLVREAFGAALRDEAPAAWQAAHGRLFEYFCGAAEKTPDDLVGLEPLYRAVMHGCAAGRQREALEDVYIRRIKRGNQHDSSNVLGAFAADLAALAHFFDRPWSRPHSGLPAASRAWLSNEAGFALRAVGRLPEAVEPMAAGLTQLVEQQDWRQAAIAAGNLSELLLTMGRLDPPGAADGALARGRQAVEYADRSGDGFARITARATLADALHQRGRRAAARALFADAERLQAEIQPGLPRLYSLQGYKYGELLLADRPIEARQRAGWLLALNQGPGVLSAALDHLLLARAALAESPPDLGLARTHTGVAVAGLRRAGQQDELPRGLLTRAALHRHTGALDAATADLAEARSIAERGGMRLHLVDADLEAARLALARDERDAATRAYAAAREGVRAIRYHRRDPELQALGEALGETPPGWLHEANIEVSIPVEGL